MAVFPITQTPLIVPGLVFWGDGNDPAGTGIQPANSTALSVWFDKSGSANSGAQASGSLQPTFQSNILQGKGAVRFSGTKYMSNPQNGFPFGSTGRTIFIVLNPSTLNSVQYIFSYGDPTGTGTLSGWEITNVIVSQRFFFDARNVYAGGTTTTLTTATNYLLESNYTAASNINTVALKVNGVSQSLTSAAGTPNTTNTGNCYIGSYSTAGSSLFTGDVFEILFYNRSLTASETNIIRLYLANKWGIAI